MSLLSDIIVALNSCSYDIAAAFSAVGLAVLRILSINYPASGDVSGGDAFLGVYTVIARITSYAFCLILVTGAVMAGYVEGRGGPLMFGYLQVVSLTIKYGIMLILAVVGLFIWSGLSRKVVDFRSKHNL